MIATFLDTHYTELLVSSMRMPISFKGLLRSNAKIVLECLDQLRRVIGPDSELDAVLVDLEHSMYAMSAIDERTHDANGIATWMAVAAERLYCAKNVIVGDCHDRNMVAVRRRRVSYSVVRNYDELREVAALIRRVLESSPSGPLAATVLRGSALEWWGESDTKNWSEFAGNTESVLSLEYLLRKGDLVHVGDFGRVVAHVGFPFTDATRLAQLVNKERQDERDYYRKTDTDVEQQERLGLFGQMVQIEKQYATMKDDVRWLIGYAKELQKTSENWADVWARTDPKDPDGQKAGAIQVRLRTLYDEYRMLWGMCRYSHELFEMCDFPGKHRIGQMLTLAEPMDEANLRVRMGCMRQATGEVWTKGRPDVYPFLRTVLAYLGHAAPPEIRVGKKD